MKWSGMLAVTAASVLFVTTLGMAGLFHITTETGADTYVTPSDAPFIHGDDHHMIAWDYDEPNWFKIYVRFEIWPTLDTVATATLTCTTIDGQFPTGMTIWGLNDGDVGEFWDDSATVWFNAPANDAASATGFLSNATFLGEFGNITNAPGGTGEFSGDALKNFLNADTNAVATLMFASPNGFAFLATDENPFFPPPTLTVEVGSLGGDLDGNGFVGQSDLDIALGNWGQTVPPADPQADPDGDNFVGQNDLDAVLGVWGQTTPPSVPEPATVGMLALGGLALLRRKWRFRSRYTSGSGPTLGGLAVMRPRRGQCRAIASKFLWLEP